jgi:transcriptional regulator with XRE-family HTH domain
MEFAPVDVVEIRSRFELTQRDFADLLGISVDTLRNWERGRRFPVGPARALLRIADSDPDLVAKVLIRHRVHWTPEETDDVDARVERFHRRRSAERAEREQAQEDAAARLDAETGDTDSGIRIPFNWSFED